MPIPHVPPRRHPRLLVLAILSLASIGPALLLTGASAPGVEPLPIIPGTGRGRAPDPLTASLMERAEPRNDPDWESEALADSVKSRLDGIGIALASGRPIGPSAISALIVPGFICEALRPGALKEVFRDGLMIVARGEPGPASSKGGPRRGAEGLARALTELGAPMAGMRDIRVDFIPIRVESDAGSLLVSAWFHASGRGPGGGIEQTALWRTRWKVAEAGVPPLLESIQVEGFEEVSSKALPGPLFSDATEAVLGANKSFRGMLLYGVDHWLERMESWIESDSFGHNGIALGDVNGDGLEDIYLCQMAGLPNLLFVQNPDGTATDVSAAAGVDWLERTRSALFLDLDNDGDQDLVVATSVAILFMANDGAGRFKVNATLSVPQGLVSVSGPAAPATSVGLSPEDSAAGHYSRAGDIGGTRTSDIVMMAAADYDQDGFVDIYACAYHASSQEADRFPIPIPYHDANNGGANLLLKNDGQWRFTNVTKEAGLDVNNSRFSFAASWEDFDNDGDQDLFVANDFGRKNLYRNDGGRFTDVAPAAGVEDIGAGMSASWGDYNHDGWMDLYVANMFSSAGSRLAHQPRFMVGAPEAIRALYQRHARGNSLFANAGDGTFRDVSVESGTTLGRWAWASLFTDINNDGWDDIFVTNGYFTREDPLDLCSFFWRQVVSRSPVEAVDPATVPGYSTAWRALGRLIREGESFNGRERKCAFLNTRGGRFATVSASTGLDFIDDGRGVAVTDWDSDGDLDLWLENRTGPRLRFARNDLPAGGPGFLMLKLEGVTCNRDAIGARLELYVDGGRSPVIQTLRAGEGYLSQSSKWIHFGLGASPRIDRLVVRWPGGAAEEYKGLRPDHSYRLVQGSDLAQEIPPRGRPVRLAASAAPLEEPPSAQEARIFLSAPVPAPILRYAGFDGRPAAIQEGGSPAILLNLWASWCAPCVRELGELARRHDELKRKGVRVVALSVDRFGGPEKGDDTAAARMASGMKLPFEAGVAPDDLIDKLRLAQSRIIWAPRPFPIPTSFLIDADGLLSVIYKGPVTVERILEDLPALRLSGERRLAMALPFPGIRQTRSMPDRFEHMGALARTYAEGGYPDEAVAYYRRVLRIKPNDARTRLDLGTALAGQGLADEAIEQYREALKIEPENVAVLSNLGFALAGQGKIDEAIDHYHRALELDPGNSATLTNLGAALASRGQLDEAVASYRRAIDSDPGYAPALNNLAVALARMGNVEEAIASYRRLLDLDPSSVVVRLNLGMALSRQGKRVEATEQFAEAVRLKPDQPEARYHFGLALAGQGKLDQAAAELTEATRLNPEHAQARYFLSLVLAKMGRTQEASRHISELMRVPAGSPQAGERLAWALATQADAALRDGEQAIKLALEVCQATHDPQASSLDTLAAAYAEAGRFREAVETARRAVDAALAGGQNDLAARIKGRLRLYEGGRPFREGRAAD
ncbi:MAG TPA: tetratricopeptide repeat protein [Candidatus Polarisedimenticolia bacterium]|jgi:tetratricopeptide (TPR) repeat protein